MEDQPGLGWTQIPWGDEYEALWRQFDARFGFHAGTQPTDWPGITEPAGAVTLDLRPVFESAHAEFGAGEDAVNALVRLALLRTAPPGALLTVLDWQHAAYRFAPHEAKGPTRDWPIPPFPNGDYYVFLGDDMTVGTFGHPWEQTLCVFGPDLVETLVPLLTTWLPIRRDLR